MESEGAVREVEPAAAPSQAAGGPVLAPAAGPTTMAARVLALSRSAGNATVARAIADGRIVARQPGPAPPAAAPAPAGDVSAVPAPPVAGAVELSEGPMDALLTTIEGWSPRDEWLDAHVRTPGVDAQRIDLAERIVFRKETGVDEWAAVETARDLYVIGASVEERDAVFVFLGLAGLALPSSIEAFATDSKSAAAAIATMGTFAERAEKVRGVINARLQAAGVPQIGAITPAGGGSAHFHKESWTVTVDPEFAMRGEASAPAELLTTVYHEARHAEQDFLIARHMARTKTAEEIRDAHGVPQAVAEAAKNSPLPADDPQAELAERLQEPVDLTPDPELAAIRPRLIEKKQRGEPFTPEEQAILDRAYARYRARPNEADAFLVAELAELRQSLGE